MRFFGFAASYRANSVNRLLINAAAPKFEAAGHELHIFDMKQRYDVPLYDGDVQDGVGIPEGAQAFAGDLAEFDGFAIATPEYNASIPGTLKNLVDWVSRIRPNPFAGTHALLMSAAPGFVGGNRGLWQTRIPFEMLSVHVYPRMMAVSKAKDTLSAEGLTAPVLDQQLEALVAEFTSFVSRR